jgi:hypothetical protein
MSTRHYDSLVIGSGNTLTYFRVVKRTPDVRLRS